MNFTKLTFSLKISIDCMSNFGISVRKSHHDRGRLIIDHGQVITQMFHDSLALRRFTRPVTTFKNDQGTSFSCGSHIWR